MWPGTTHKCDHTNSWGLQVVLSYESITHTLLFWIDSGGYRYRHYKTISAPMCYAKNVHSKSGIRPTRWKFIISFIRIAESYIKRRTLQKIKSQSRQNTTKMKTTASVIILRAGFVFKWGDLGLSCIIIKIFITSAGALHTAVVSITVRVKNPCPQGNFTIIPEDDRFSFLNIPGAKESLPTSLQ